MFRKNESLDDYIEYHIMPLIGLSYNYLNSDHENFIRNFDTEFVNYLFINDLWTIFENFDVEIDPDSFEDEHEYRVFKFYDENIRNDINGTVEQRERFFIEDITKYLLRKKRSNLKRIDECIEEFINKGEITFESEIYKILERSERNKHEQTKLIEVFDELIPELGIRTEEYKKYIKELKYLDRKINYLKIRAEKLGYEISFRDELNFQIIKENVSEENVSNNIMNTARAKFLMLNEIRFIKFLKDEYPDLPDASIHKILTDITGINQQPTYSAFKGRDNDPGNHNNPYRSPSENRSNPVEIIRNRLRGYGIKIDN